jgi:hypothetical protein
MESKGIETGRWNINREIVRHNNILTAIMANPRKLKDKLKDALSGPAPDSLQGILPAVRIASDEENAKQGQRKITRSQNQNLG